MASGLTPANQKEKPMVAQRRSLETMLLSSAFIALGLAGIVVLFSALPRSSSTFPRLALCAFVWSCAFIVAAVLTWRRSCFAVFAFVAAIALLLFPAKIHCPRGPTLSLFTLGVHSCRFTPLSPLLVFRKQGFHI